MDENQFCGAADVDGSPTSGAVDVEGGCPFLGAADAAGGSPFCDVIDVADGRPSCGAVVDVGGSPSCGAVGEAQAYYGLCGITLTEEGVGADGTDQ